MQRRRWIIAFGLIAIGLTVCAVAVRALWPAPVPAEAGGLTLLDDLIRHPTLSAPMQLPPPLPPADPHSPDTLEFDKIVRQIGADDASIREIHDLNPSLRD